MIWPVQEAFVGVVMKRNAEGELEAWSHTCGVTGGPCLVPARCARLDPWTLEYGCAYVVDLVRASGVRAGVTDCADVGADHVAVGTRVEVDRAPPGLAGAGEFGPTAGQLAGLKWHVMVRQMAEDRR